MFFKIINYIPNNLSWLLSVNSVKALTAEGYFTN